MVSVVIPVLREEPALVETLAALVPAAAEGLVRDLVLAVQAESDVVREIADAAGCGIVSGPGGRAELVNRAAERVKGPYVLVLEPGLAPGGDWMAEILDFLEDIGTQGGRAAVFTLAGRGGIGPQSRLLALNLAASFLGRAHPSQGLVAHRDDLLSGRYTVTRLSSPIHDRRHKRRSR
jgi:hypothetical protein